MAFCRDTTLVATGHIGQMAIPIKCRSWGCDYCQPMRQRQLLALAFSGAPNRFITITCRRGQRATPDEAAKALAEAWRTVIRRWRRLSPQNTGEYLCVIEAHKSGWPHLHILFRGAWMAWSYLKSQMTSLLNSPSVYIKYMSKSSLVAAYVTKYCGKAPHRFATTKRYWSSKKYSLKQSTDAPKDFHKGLDLEHRKTNITAIESEWREYKRLVWNLEPDIIGWGDPWSPRGAPPRQPLTSLQIINGQIRHMLLQATGRGEKRARM